MVKGDGVTGEQGNHGLEGACDNPCISGGDSPRNRSCGNGKNGLSPSPHIHFSAIPSSFSRGYPLSLRERLFLGLICGALFGLFGIAACLTPDQQGFGTHQQLGLPPCTLRTLFRIPCPTCGMTTSFAHFVRGDLLSACRVNPAGLVVALSCLMMIPWSLWGIIRGKLLWVGAPAESAVTGCLCLVGVSLVTWLIQIMI